MTDAFVAVHGALMQASVLMPLATALGRPMIAPGLPAHRGGVPWDGARDYHDQATEAVLAKLPEAPVDMFGHSLGGTVALRVAAEHSARVRSLVLFEPVFFAAAPEAAFANHMSEMEPFHTALAQGRDGSAAAVFHGLWGTGAPWESLPDLVRKSMLRLLPVIEASAPGIVQDRAGFLPKLAACPVPTLVLHHAEPPEIVAGITEGLITRMPNAKAVAIEGPGRHMQPLAAVDAVAAAIRDFWDQIA